MDSIARIDQLFNLLFFLEYEKYKPNPINIQTNELIWVSPGKEMIIDAQTKIPRSGTIGTNGVLKGRTNVGFDFLKIITPAHTKINANKVPMLVKSPATLPGINAAKAPTNANKTQFDLKGVLYLGCKSENNFGSKPSFAIE